MRMLAVVLRFNRQSTSFRRAADSVADARSRSPAVRVASRFRRRREEKRILARSRCNLLERERGPCVVPLRTQSSSLTDPAPRFVLRFVFRSIFSARRVPLPGPRRPHEAYGSVFREEPTTIGAAAVDRLLKQERKSNDWSCTPSLMSTRSCTEFLAVVCRCCFAVRTRD